MNAFSDKATVKWDFKRAFRFTNDACHLMLEAKTG